MKFELQFKPHFRNAQSFDQLKHSIITEFIKSTQVLTNPSNQKLTMHIIAQSYDIYIYIYIYKWQQVIWNAYNTANDGPNGENLPQGCVWRDVAEADRRDGHDDHVERVPVRQRLRVAEIQPWIAWVLHLFCHIGGGRTHTKTQYTRHTHR